MTPNQKETGEIACPSCKELLSSNTALQLQVGRLRTALELAKPLIAFGKVELPDGKYKTVWDVVNEALLQPPPDISKLENVMEAIKKNGTCTQCGGK